MSNYQHLDVIPFSDVRQKPKIVERILMTIIKKFDNKGGLKLQQIENEFQHLLKRSFEALEVGPLVSFISTRHELFSIDAKEYLTCSEKAKNIYLDLKGLNPNQGENCIIPSKYYKTNNNYNNYNNYNNTNKPNKNKVPVLIDLTNE